MTKFYIPRVWDEIKYKNSFWYRLYFKTRHFFSKRKSYLATIILTIGGFPFYYIYLIPSEQDRINNLRRKMLKDSSGL